MGAWIEINFAITLAIMKYTVAPFVGAWIEIDKPVGDYFGTAGRTLRGCVD